MRARDEIDILRRVVLPPVDLPATDQRGEHAGLLQPTSRQVDRLAVGIE
ncbi:MAG: hypothetical protein U0232_06245 [Thermomicrobiales bacterium]